MALVNGPLFSLGASGQVGKAIVYSKWKGRDYVREYVIPANPRSMAQIFQRGMLTALARWWAGLAEVAGAQASWNSLASSKNISPFNAQISYNLDRETLNLLPVGDLDAGLGPQGAVTSVTGSSPEAGRLVADLVIDANQDPGELLLVSIGTDGGANTTAMDVRRTIGGNYLEVAQTAASIDVAGLAPGTYFVGGRVVGPDGTSSAIAYTASGVVVA